jgi:hypothetical protein
MAQPSGPAVGTDAAPELGTSARPAGGFRISAHPRSLAPHHERAKRGQFHPLAMLKTINNFLEHKLHQCCRLRPRQTDLPVDRVAQINAGQFLSKFPQCRSFDDLVGKGE